MEPSPRACAQTRDQTGTSTTGAHRPGQALLSRRIRRSGQWSEGHAASALSERGPDPGTAVPRPGRGAVSSRGGSGSAGEAALHPADFKAPGGCLEPRKQQQLGNQQEVQVGWDGESGSGISDAQRCNSVQFLGYYDRFWLAVTSIFSCSRNPEMLLKQ